MVCHEQKVGVTICEDLWVGRHDNYSGKPDYQEDPAARQVAMGAQSLINLSASPYDQGKPARRVELVQSTARRLERPVILVNLVGGNDELVFDGHSVACNAKGEILARAKGFEEELLVFDLETTTPASDTSTPGELEEIYQALVLGVRDYAAKSGFSRALLGLSGGIDSALVAVIAADALGSDQVTAVAMPTRFTADLSNDCARELASRLGCPFQMIPVEDSFNAMLKTLEPHLEGKPEDVTEENLQPRLRGMILMALSNKHGALLLSTGNKSELAVGYCTLYGDMCGGLAVISDLPKTTVFALAEHINSTRGEVIPRPIIDRPPSAELRMDQKDSDSLPEYSILDDILHRSIEGLESTADLVKAGHDPMIVEQVLDRLWRNEYKRKQMPPGLRVTSKAFGTGRRMPITGASHWFDRAEMKMD